MQLKRISTITCMLMSLFASGNAFAQDSIRITLNEALDIALSDNPTIRIAENEIQLKKYGKNETIAGLLPNISANGSFQDNLKLQKMKLDFAPEPISMGQKYTTTGSFNLSIPIVAPQLWKTLQLNQQDIEIGRAHV